MMSVTRADTSNRGLQQRLRSANVYLFSHGVRIRDQQPSAKSSRDHFVFVITPVNSEHLEKKIKSTMALSSKKLAHILDMNTDRIKDEVDLRFVRATDL